MLSLQILSSILHRLIGFKIFLEMKGSLNFIFLQADLLCFKAATVEPTDKILAALCLSGHLYTLAYSTSKNCNM